MPVTGDAGNDSNEERAKMVKSKKIRLLMESPSTLSSSSGQESSKPPNKTLRVAKSKCDICGAVFTHLDDLNWHKKIVHPVPNVAVENVRKSLRIQAKSKRKKNLEDVEVVEIMNELDEKPNVTNNETISNTKSKHGHVVLICHQCGYKCKRKSTLIKHMATYHPKDEVDLDGDQNRSVLSCAICLKRFSRKGYLRRHVLNHGFLNEADDQMVKSDPKLKRGYCCDICNRGFHRQGEMLAHRDATHDTAEPLEWSTFCGSRSRLQYCNQCCKHFNDNKLFSGHECVKGEPEQVTERIRELLDSTPTYKCDVCSVCFHWKWLFRHHRENVHHLVTSVDSETFKTEIKFFCKSCLKAFDDDDQLSKHRRDCSVKPENKVGDFPCSLCTKSFTRKTDFQRHVRIQHPDPEQNHFQDVARRKKTDLGCPYCGVQLANRNFMLMHIKDTHNIETDTPFACVPCNKVFKRKATLDSHNEIYHPKEENSEEMKKLIQDAEFLLNGEIAYHCNECNRNLSSSTKFLAHHRLHNMERRYTCDLCGKQTRTQHQLNTHIKIIHLNLRNFECDICHKSFHSKQSCEEHRRIHTGERPFSCEICGKTFIALNALFTHKKFHNDFFAYPCSMCPKKFKIRTSLINHIRTHTGERPYKCDLCPKTFNTSSRFSYHKKVTHSDNRPFTCDQCGSCFKANKFLMRHMKLHSTRTHIQFRRRNNPAYFETHDKNPKKPTLWTGPRKKTKNAKSDADSVAKSTDGASPATFTIRRITFNGVEDIRLENGSGPRNGDEALHSDMRDHFLAEAFIDNSNPNDLGVQPANDSGHSGSKQAVGL